MIPSVIPGVCRRIREKMIPDCLLVPSFFPWVKVIQKYHHKIIMP